MGSGRTRAVRRRGDATLRAELLTVGSGDNAGEQFVQSDLAARGITVTIRQMEMGAFLAAALFVALLVEGLLWAWWKGVLTWR